MKKGKTLKNDGVLDRVVFVWTIDLYKVQVSSWGVHSKVERHGNTWCFPFKKRTGVGDWTTSEKLGHLRAQLKKLKLVRSKWD